MLARPTSGLREAAVLVPLFLREGEPHVLFTRRPATLRRHPGQIAFPGGARDEADPTLLHTALREAHEELGLPPDRVQVLGSLDELPTITSFRVSPFVGLIPDNFPFALSEVEVESIFDAKVDALRDPAIYRRELRRVMDEDHEVHYYQAGPHLIWGATGQILRDLLRTMTGL